MGTVASLAECDDTGYVLFKSDQFKSEVYHALTESDLQFIEYTSSSAMAERPRELGDFKAMDHFEAKF